MTTDRDDLEPVAPEQGQRLFLDHRATNCSKLPRPTRSLGAWGPRSLLEGGAFPKRHCAPRPHVVRESEALSSSRKAQAPFERHGRGPASSFRSTVEAAGRSSAATRAYRTYAVDCPAGLIPGVLALYPSLGTQRPVACVRGRRSRVSGAKPSGLAPQEPVYSWLLPTPACARTAVTHCHETDGRKPFERASSPPYRSLRSRLRTEAPRYRLQNCFEADMSGASGGRRLPSAEGWPG